MLAPTPIAMLFFFFFFFGMRAKYRYEPLRTRKLFAISFSSFPGSREMGGSREGGYIWFQSQAVLAAYSKG